MIPHYSVVLCCISFSNGLKVMKKWRNFNERNIKGLRMYQIIWNRTQTKKSNICESVACAQCWGWFIPTVLQGWSASSLVSLYSRCTKFGFVPKWKGLGADREVTKEKWWSKADIFMSELRIHVITTTFMFYREILPIKSGLRFSLFILSKVELFRYGTRKVTTDIKVCSVCCLLLLGSCFLVMLLL